MKTFFCTRMIPHLLLILLFVSLVINYKPVEASVETSLRWTEREYSKLLTSPTVSHEIGTERDTAICVADDFKAILKKYGPNGRTYLGLARCQALAGQYDAALMSYEQALLLSPKNTHALKESADVQIKSDIARAAGKTFKKDRKVCVVSPFRVSKGRDLWLVLSSKSKSPSTARDMELPYEDVLVSLFEGSPNSLHKICQADIKGHASMTGILFIDMYVTDLTGDGVPEVMVSEISAGGSWTPSHVDIYQWKNNCMVKILGAGSDDPLTLRDINCDGKYEVINDYAIGSYMSHVEMPRWTDIYAYKQGVYQRANGDFPKEYLPRVRELTSLLRQYPRDKEIWKYFGSTLRILSRCR